MKKIFKVMATTGMILGLGTAVMAAPSDTIDINWEVAALNSLAITEAGPLAMTLDSDEGDGTFTDAVETIHYDASTNSGVAMKITGQITAMAAGLTLSAQAADDGGSFGTTVVGGPVALEDAASHDLIRDISAGATSNQEVVLTMDAPITQAASTGTTTLTMTIVTQ